MSGGGGGGRARVYFKLNKMNWEGVRVK